MTHKELKKYILEKYKRQVELYKKVYRSHKVLSQQIFLSRIELMEAILADIFGWYISVGLNEERDTTIYNCFGNVGMSRKEIYSWNLGGGSLNDKLSEKKK